MQLKTSDFYYDLPKELIAQDPLTDRAASRLMVLDKKTGEVEHHVFRDVINYLNPGDCLVINNTKVIPARLIGTKVDTGASIEVLLLRRLKDRESTWETLVRPGKKCKVGTKDIVRRRSSDRRGCGRCRGRQPLYPVQL
jgi:S-adenosylmethionine:tRNA ribosyltransferase-isomerase